MKFTQKGKVNVGRKRKSQRIDGYVATTMFFSSELTWRVMDLSTLMDPLIICFKSCDVDNEMKFQFKAVVKQKQKKKIEKHVERKE